MLGGKGVVTQPAICQWLNGTSRPKHELRLAIERTIGIPAVDWMTASEKATAFGSATGTDG